MWRFVGVCALLAGCVDSFEPGTWMDPGVARSEQFRLPMCSAGDECSRVNLHLDTTPGVQITFKSTADDARVFVGTTLQDFTLAGDATHIDGLYLDVLCFEWLNCAYPSEHHLIADSLEVGSPIPDLHLPYYDGQPVVVRVDAIN